jgi:hypothetical protein
VIVAVDRDHRRRLQGRTGDGVEMIGVHGQGAKAAELAGIVHGLPLVIVQAQATEAVFEPTAQVAVLGHRQPGAGAQLPGRTGMVGRCRWQGCPAVADFAPGLPETVRIGQAIQPALLVEARLLQAAVAGHAFGHRGQLAAHQARLCPGLVWAVPFDPGQAGAIGAQYRRGIEVRAFGQHPASFAGKVDGHHSMTVTVFLDGQDLPCGVFQSTIARLSMGHRLRQATGHGLAVQLLVGLVDEHQLVVGQAEGTAAVFIHPAAHAEAIGRQAVVGAVAFGPQPAGAVLRAKFVPEHPRGTGLQLSEIGTGGNGLRGTEAVMLWR